MAEKKTVFMSIGTDVIHGGHMEIIHRAAQLGELTVGVLTDEVVASYKRHPLLSCEERMKIVAGLKGVAHVIEQDGLGYAAPLRALRPWYPWRPWRPRYIRHPWRQHGLWGERAHGDPHRH